MKNEAIEAKDLKSFQTVKMYNGVKTVKACVLTNDPVVKDGVKCRLLGCIVNKENHEYVVPEDKVFIQTTL